ncbi:hypothetical protein Taro_031646 [Colocasia esculenta]|uniref:CCHC-type domain-containing protein n=1 Tax=Colocasia esculenta TaxID=4460 RepID=A0A843VPE6_COLES|nr:hypothetical protein [Colocasia esculenta]
MERFKRMAPPSFKGESQPLLAESWIREIEMIFRAIRCAEDDKVSLATYMLQDRKKVAYHSPQRLVAASSQQAVAPQSPSVRPSGKKECPYCGRTNGGTNCWKLAGKCLKCSSSEHQIRDCPRLQQGIQRGAPAPAVAAVAAPTTERPGRPRAKDQVFALARVSTSEEEIARSDSEREE